MREYLFRGIRVDNGELVEGYYVKAEKLNGDGYEHFIIEEAADGRSHLVIPESVGLYTGMNEFVITDRSFHKPLFEGDIVEVWSRRRPSTEGLFSFRSKPTSQYDVEVKARAVIRFKNGEWSLDYNNNYNKALYELRGNEQYERTVEASERLYDFGYRHNSENEEWHREHNAHYKWDDIVKIGTEFENSELLEE